MWVTFFIALFIVFLVSSSFYLRFKDKPFPWSLLFGSFPLAALSLFFSILSFFFRNFEDVKGLRAFLNLYQLSLILALLAVGIDKIFCNDIIIFTKTKPTCHFLNSKRKRLILILSWFIRIGIFGQIGAYLYSIYIINF